MPLKESQDSHQSNHGLDTQRTKSYILVYKGEGSGKDSRKHFYAALKQVVDPTYHCVDYITPEQIKEGSWMKNCHAIAFGGGYDLGFIKALGKNGTKIIREFVQQGGAYLGICAGAYWASDYIEFDKGGPLQVVGERFLKFYPGKCIGPAYPGFQYNSKKGVHAVPVLYKGCSLFMSYLHGGGFFTLPPEHGSPLGCQTEMEQRESEPSFVNEESVFLEKDVHKCKGSSCNDSDGCSYNPLSQEKGSNIYIIPKNALNGISQSNQLLSLTNHQLSTHTTHPILHRSQSVDSNSHSNDEQVSFKTLATFTSLEQCPSAVVHCQVGKGTAILCGVHLEFPVALLDHENLDLKPVLPQLQESEATRHQVFTDILQQLRVRVKPPEPCL
ncbi:biotin--protein ligase [Plakobranchus ocellatus]|uniref:Biotin--protein ligase n=1 Tax=Plakobranchus ocellatus TaxID=259542 RepID=A0AAV4AZN9_9GAST|nr:biotin--protein ligase [Plakobranchus ocellatus]